MTSIEHARKILLENFKHHRISELPILDTLGYVLAENIHSPDKLPRFNQSAMDGYALRSKDTKSNQISKLNIVTSIFSGDDITGITIKKNECAEITTGAPLPNGTDAVIPIEEVEREGNILYIKRKVSKFENVRFAGEDVKFKELIAKKGETITPHMIGLFSAVGITKVKVFLPPAVGIITTGTEIESLNKKPKKYQIRNSNLYTLKALLKEYNINPAFTKIFSDKKGLIINFLKKLDKLPDIIITTGGVSVGKRDYVKEELGKFGVKNLFWKVAQKPGKPFYTGIKNKTIFLGLPGNPGAVITCFYYYIVPLINKFMKKEKIFLKEEYGILEKDIENKSKRTLFLNAHFKKSKIKVLKKQGSHIISSFSKANSFLILKPGQRYKKGDKIKIYLTNTNT